MIGNLSKSIVKLPNFFLKTLDENYDIENEKTENNLIFQNNNYNRHSNIFREKDFLRFAPLVENLNFNRNRRHILFSKLNSNRKKIDFNDIVKSEEVYTSNLTSSNNNNNININNNDNNKTNSELFKNNNDLTQTVKTEKFNYESKLIPIQQDEIDNFNNTVRTNIDNLINKIKNDSKRTSFRNSKISINENNNNNENNENNNENNENKNETFNYNSFPKNSFLPFNTKSYDSLFKEMLDQKISSLKLITPKQKKEIFSRNSNFESKSTFDRYKHFYDNYDYNNY